MELAKLFRDESQKIIRSMVVVSSSPYFGILTSNQLIILIMIRGQFCQQNNSCLRIFLRRLLQIRSVKSKALSDYVPIAFTLRSVCETTALGQKKNRAGGFFLLVKLTSEFRKNCGALKYHADCDGYPELTRAPTGGRISAPPPEVFRE